MRPTLAVVAVVAATALLGAAEAQSDEEPIRLEYRAPSGCDTDAQFFARARSRAPKMRMARPEERARMFVVDIEQRGGRTWGKLTVRNPEGRQTVREIEAKDCSEAADALALVVALVVNPRAQMQAAPPAGPSPSDLPAQGSSAKPPGAPAPTASTAGSAAAPTAPPRSASPAGSIAPATSSEPATTLARTSAPSLAETSSVPPSSESSHDGAHWALRAGLGAWGVSAMAPEPLLGARASAETLHLDERVLAPSLRASFGLATHTGFVVDGGTAHFTYAGTNVEICPLRVPPSASVVLRPCVMADAGLLFARGSSALNPRESTRPWLDIGVGGRLEWMLGRGVGVDLDIACMFPIWRDRFLFGDRSFYRVAPVGGVAAVGFVMRIL